MNIRRNQLPLEILYTDKGKAVPLVDMLHDDEGFMGRPDWGITPKIAEPKPETTAEIAARLQISLKEVRRRRRAGTL